MNFFATCKSLIQSFEACIRRLFLFPLFKIFFGRDVTKCTCRLFYYYSYRIMTEKVFHELVFCYRDNMYRFARNLLNDDTGAQDTVQSVMLKMWQQKDKLAGLGDLKAYVMRAVKNECLNKMRQQEINRRHLALAGAQQPLTDNNNRGNMRQLIFRFIDTLPEKQRIVILLKDMEEFETNEIAALMEMDEPAVRTNLARARQKVRTYLQKIETYEQQQLQGTAGKIL